MVISVTSPRKGMGQTVTAINLAASIYKFTGSRVLLADLNGNYRDMENYLLGKGFARGLDEFISLHETGLLSHKTFSACVTGVHGLDLMGANRYMELDSKTVEGLFKIVSGLYDAAVIDTVSGSSELTGMFLKRSDVVLVVINQMKIAVDWAARNGFYRDIRGELIFVVNRYMKNFGGGKVRYLAADIKKDLKKAGMGVPVFPLAYDPDFANDCNDRAVLNYTLGRRSPGSLYLRQMEAIVRKLFPDSSKARPLVAGEGRKLGRKAPKLLSG